MRQKIKENLNKIVNSNFFIIILMIVVFLKTILFYKSTICINEKIYINTIQMSIMYIMTLLVWYVVFITKKRAKYSRNNYEHIN